jgi:hypothetical protein
MFIHIKRLFKIRIYFIKMQNIIFKANNVFIVIHTYSVCKKVLALHVLLVCVFQLYCSYEFQCCIRIKVLTFFRNLVSTIVVLSFKLVYNVSTVNFTSLPSIHCKIR